MSSAVEVLETLNKIDKPRSKIEVLQEALRHNSIQMALVNVSDDVMTNEDEERETQKAIKIMEDAIYKILGDCDLFGDSSILEVNNVSYPARYSCFSFMEKVMSEAVSNVDREIN